MPNNKYNNDEITTLHNLLIRNKKDRILTSDEVRLLDRIYENISSNEHRIKRWFSLEHPFILNKEYN